MILYCTYCGGPLWADESRDAEHVVAELRCGRCLLTSCDTCMNLHDCQPIGQGGGTDAVREAIERVRGGQAPTHPVIFALDRQTVEDG